MINAFYKNRYALPVNDGNVVKWFDKTTKKYGKVHLGLDISWWECPVPKGLVYAVQDGKVVEVGKDDELGWYIVLQHEWSDKTYSFSCYIHLASKPTLAENTLVKMNDTIGIKGNTGTSNGTHLHFYLTGYTTKQWSKSATFWKNTFRPLCIDPYPYLYRSKTAKYVYLGSYLKDKPYLEDLPQPITYPTPVERNEKVKQCEVIMDQLRLRDTPAGNIYDDLCTRGIYNVLDEEKSGAYNWYLIDEINGKQFWVASGGQRTKDLEVKDEIAELREKVSELENQNTILLNKINSAKKELE